MTTTDHVRIIAEAMGWTVDGGGVYKGDRLVLLTADDEDVFIFAAHAVSWAAGKGWRVCADDFDPNRVMLAHHGLGFETVSRLHDPEDPHDTARATLAAVAEVVGLMNQGGE